MRDAVTISPSQADTQTFIEESAMNDKIGRVDHFLLIHSARADKWRDITHQAADWAAGRGDRPGLEAAVAEMAAVEEYHAYPGALLAPTNELPLRYEFCDKS
jgi:hypothetical protein